MQDSESIHSLAPYWYCNVNFDLEILYLVSRAYSDAAISITVTSLTDFLSFIVGALTPIPCVSIYCMYTGVAVGFIYLWHITFFGACLVSSL